MRGLLLREGRGGEKRREGRRKGRRGGEEEDWERRGGKGERRVKESGGEGVPLLCLSVPLQLAVAGDATDTYYNSNWLTNVFRCTVQQNHIFATGPIKATSSGPIVDPPAPAIKQTNTLNTSHIR